MKLGIVKIVRETEVKEMDIDADGILFAARRCVVRGNLYALGPIIALGDLNVKGKIVGELSLMVGGP